MWRLLKVWRLLKGWRLGEGRHRRWLRLVCRRGRTKVWHTIGGRVLCLEIWDMKIILHMIGRIDSGLHPPDLGLLLLSLRLCLVSYYPLKSALIPLGQRGRPSSGRRITNHGRSPHSTSTSKVAPRSTFTPSRRAPVTHY